ncbi:MAG: hypothetical protein K0S00_2868 [Xanthobacteraceae bacterium]|jgi:hypothetical protein|nr:hypothetical protein [Xanthobacteraceae bacterium]
MKINLSPQRRDDTLTAFKNGDVLTINGEAIDFSGLPDGATVPNGAVLSDWIVGEVSRVAGDLELTLILPHGPSPSHAVAFPAPILNPADGAIVLPADEETL